MIFQKIRVSACLSDGHEAPLHRGGKGKLLSRWADADVFHKKVKGGFVLYVGATLKRESTFDATKGLQIRFLQEDVPYLAYYMRCEFWCRPAFGTSFADVPSRTQALLFKEGEQWRVLWSLCGDAFNCTLSGDREGLKANLYGGAEGDVGFETMPALVYCSGNDPYKVLRKAALIAEEVLGGRVMTLDKKPYPKIFEYLGWCSWDAMEIHVNEAGLLAKAAELKRRKIPVRWCIIDDMWAHVKGIKDIPMDMPRGPMVKIMHASKLYAMEADPDRFPNGLGHTIEKLKKQGLQVGVWYPTTGYWSGIDPEGPLVHELGDALETLPNGRIVAKPTAEATRRFHNAMQDMLVEAGADFVKVDNQTHYRNNYNPYYPVGVAAKAVQEAIEDVTEAHFGDGLINCMGMGNESMWHRRKSAVSRCSGDFCPENREWFAKHVQQCAYNSLFQGQFHYSDWDMWWTDDAQALKNSVCHAISGGPIYISDKIERSRAEVLRPLCMSDGRILRADELAVPIAACLLEDPTTSDHPFCLKSKARGCGLLAAFNIHKDNKPQSGVVYPRDLGLIDDSYLVREQLSGDNLVLKKGEGLKVELADNDDLRLYVFYRIGREVVPLGRIDKLLSPKMILSSGEKRLRLREGGKIALFGAREISTNRRSYVTGKQVGEITVFDLIPEETIVDYL